MFVKNETIYDSCTGITLELRMAILKGNYGKIFPRSGILRDHFITCDSGVIDADYRGTVVILLINHSSEHYTVRVGNTIAQMVFMRKFNVNFAEVSDSVLFGKIQRDMGGFGSTGTSSILVKKPSQEVLVIDD